MLEHPWNFGIQKTEKKVKETIYSYHRHRIWKANYGSVFTYVLNFLKLQNWMAANSAYTELLWTQCKDSTF